MSFWSKAIFLLIFCSDGLYVSVSIWVPYYDLFFCFSLISLNSCFMYLSAPWLEAGIFMCYHLWLLAILFLLSLWSVLFCLSLPFFYLEVLFHQIQIWLHVLFSGCHLFNVSFSSFSLCFYICLCVSLEGSIMS